MRPSTSAPGYGFAGSYRRPSFTSAGNRGIVYSGSHHDRLTKEERKRILEEERSLLRDNQIIPPKHPDGTRHKFGIPFTGSQDGPTEEAPLLGDSPQPYGGHDDPEELQQKWQEAVEAGKIQTTWQREATSLDTLCAQAYGSGRKKLVGLQMQRMVYFLWVLTIPIGIIWLLADKILERIVPEYEVARLAGLYLKVVLAGAPAYATFEAGKRYVQAQGLFSASLYVLLFCAPFNAFMNWFFVWHLEMGFVGAPLAVAITDNLLPLGLFIYVRFVSKSGMSCWNGFTKKALTNWLPMIKLALPGVVMVEAEMIAFEVLTFGASFFGTTALAAQSVLATLTSITYQIPFPLAIAGSTRVANLIGATLADAARVSTRVTFIAATVIGIMNVTILSALRDYIPHLFTSDAEVIRIVSKILPLCAAFQLFDALAANCNGILRGLGRQEVGGYVQLFCYYVIAMPISFGTGFGLGWGLWGLWTGVALALGIVAAIEFTYLYGFLDWNRSVDEARDRNMVD